MAAVLGPSQLSTYLARCLCYFHLGLPLADCKCLLPQCLSHETPCMVARFTWLETMTTHFAKLQRPAFELGQLDFLWLMLATQQQALPNCVYHWTILNSISSVGVSNGCLHLQWNDRVLVVAHHNIMADHYVRLLTAPKYQLGLTTFDIDKSPANWPGNKKTPQCGMGVPLTNNTLKWLLNNTIVACEYHHIQTVPRHVASPQAGGQSSFFPLQDPSAAPKQENPPWCFGSSRNEKEAGRQLTCIHKLPYDL